tara:strand:- start:240 stop:776 length:537 start_codon:yes stop_codon:yes gene_type:complete
MELVQKIEKINGLLHFKLTKFEDNRGYFKETYNYNSFLDYTWLQENESNSKINVFRGFHFQKNDFSQTKLIRVISGKILDITIDLRKNSKTYLNIFQLKMDESDLILVPKGIAHGFLSLSNNTLISYKVDNVYSREYDSGIHPFKSNLKIDWPIDESDIILSKKDSSLPSLKENKNYF